MKKIMPKMKKTMPKKILEEFKEFALKGNMISLAIGIIIGNIFGNLVNSIVNDILMPIIGLLTGGIDFSNMFFQLAGVRPQPTLQAAREAGATIAYGNFITLLINFLIVSWLLFGFVKLINRLNHHHESDPTQPTTEQILIEIRNLLAKKS